MTAQELIAKVLGLEKDSVSLNECELAKTAPILARLLQKAIEQRNDEGIWIQSGDPRERWKKYDVELDRIAKGEE